MWTQLLATSLPITKSAIPLPPDMELRQHAGGTTQVRWVVGGQNTSMRGPSSEPGRPWRPAGAPPIRDDLSSRHVLGLGAAQVEMLQAPVMGTQQPIASGMRGRPS